MINAKKVASMLSLSLEKSENTLAARYNALEPATLGWDEVVNLS